MKGQLKNIDLSQHFDVCFQARKDAYLCSFHSLEGFDTFIEGYRDKLLRRLEEPHWFLQHLWLNDRIVGQIEFRSRTSEPEAGCLHLMYLTPDYRGMGLATQLQDYLKSFSSP